MQLNLDHTDLITLFTYRFLLDEKNDVANIEKDVLDLVHFPERLELSYRHEWTCYVKKALANNRDRQLTANLSKFQETSPTDLEYQTLREVVENAILLNADNVVVMKSPLKQYVENLLKQ